MQYVRFWIRMMILFLPATFLILYFGAHVALMRSLVSTGIVAVFGILAFIPLWLLFQRVDPAMWSDDEYTQRIARKRQRLEDERQKNEQGDQGSSL